MNPTAVRRQRRALHAVLAGYAVALALVLGWPTPVDASLHSTLQSVLDWLHGQGVPLWVGYAKVEFAANIVLFVPLGALLALELRRRPWWLAVVAAFSISLLAELGQGLLRPERFATGWDVIANTLGTIVGVALSAAISRRRPRQSRVEEHDHAAQVLAVDGAGGATTHQARIKQR